MTCECFFYLNPSKLPVPVLIPQLAHDCAAFQNMVDPREETLDIFPEDDVLPLDMIDVYAYDLRPFAMESKGLSMFHRSYMVISLDTLDEREEVWSRKEERKQ